MDLILPEDEDCSYTKPIAAIKEEEKLFVAVGKEVKQYESLLSWAIQNSGGRTLSILHVHQPDNFIPILGEKFHWSSLKEQEVKAYRRIERQYMLKTLDEYLHICHEFGVQAEKLHIEMDSVEQGILQLIAEHNIEKLVMGAAQDGCYQTKMMEPVSKKAIYVQQHAPVKCHIWFICKGHLIHQRKFNSEARIHAQNGRSVNSNFVSMNGQNNKSIIGSRELILGEGSSHSGKFTELSSMENIRTHVSLPEYDLEANCYDWDEFIDQNHHRCLSSSHSDAQETSSGLYAEAVRKNKELEEELEKLKNDRDMLREKYQDAMDQILVLEGKVANYDQVLKELEEGFVSNAELLQVCEKDRDDLKIERDSVLKTAEELLNQSAEAASSKSDDLRFFATFTIAEIEKATNDFDPSFQLMEGENGCMYKGFISHTPVTIKMWCPEGLQGPQEFHREVEILSKVRHPNVVSLIGVCPEAWAVVYESLPSGSLQERLNPTVDTDSMPLSWQTRVRIATELCCTLIFLHSRVPERVVHGALNPASVFLDSNFTCKITDFGFSHLETLPSNESSYSSSYTDPEYLMTGVATPAMDVYSFGSILLELLTGKPTYGVTYEVENALNENTFDTLLDSSAGDWPYVLAEQLARLALRCCEENARRPDLEFDVWRILEPMRTSCGGSTSYHLGDEHREAPSYFICPIFQEVMKDPHVAADGYTYEAEALRGWLESDHDTSPMTNLQLEHCNLVPNHALRSAIQEWRQRH